MMDSALQYIIIVLGMFYLIRRAIQMVMLQSLSKRTKKQV